MPAFTPVEWVYNSTRYRFANEEVQFFATVEARWVPSLASGRAAKGMAILQQQRDELYEALESVASIIQLGTWGPDGPSIRLSVDCVHAIEAALAKARGEVK